MIVDACQPGSDAGAMFEVPGIVLERAYAPTLNLQDFCWEHAIYAGRKIFDVERVRTVSWRTQKAVLAILRDSTWQAIALLTAALGCLGCGRGRNRATFRARLNADGNCPRVTAADEISGPVACGGGTL
jgi:hypothetical protein